jgi:hypothetical protein
LCRRVDLPLEFVAVRIELFLDQLASPLGRLFEPLFDL